MTYTIILTFEVEAENNKTPLDFASSTMNELPEVWRSYKDPYDHEPRELKILRRRYKVEP